MQAYSGAIVCKRAICLLNNVVPAAAAVTCSFLDLLNSPACTGLPNRAANALYSLPVASLGTVIPIGTAILGSMLSNVLRAVRTVYNRNGLGELAAVAYSVTIYYYKLAGTVIALDGVLRTITLIEFIVLEECVETIRVIEVNV